MTIIFVNEDIFWYFVSFLDKENVKARLYSVFSGFPVLCFTYRSFK